MENFIKENVIVRFGTSQNHKRQWYPFCQQRMKEDARVISGEASLVIALLPTREWENGSKKQNLH